MACVGMSPRSKFSSAVSILRAHLPELKIRVLMSSTYELQPRSEHPHGLSDGEFDAALHQRQADCLCLAWISLAHPPLTYRRTNHGNLHVRGTRKRGRVTTTFDMTVLERPRPVPSGQDVIDRLPRLAPRAAVKQIVGESLSRTGVHREARPRLARNPELEMEPVISRTPLTVLPAWEVLQAPRPDCPQAAPPHTLR